MYELRNFQDGQQLLEYLNGLPTGAVVITTHYHDFNWHVLTKQPTHSNDDAGLEAREQKNRGGRPKGSKNRPKETTGE